MKLIKKIIFFFSLFLIYLVIKEFIQLYSLCKNIHPYFGYAVLSVILIFAFLYLLIPVIKILTLKSGFKPIRDKNEIPETIKRRIETLRNNTLLRNEGYDFSQITHTEESYNQVIDYLKKKNERIRQKYVSRLFYSTAISQNGFLDALFILSSSVNLIKETFILYNGRVNLKDMLSIGKSIYYAIAIGGSESVEYAVDELLAKFTTDSLKSIPFADKFVSSIADGYVNALLLTRISYITENYCTKLYIASDKELSPTMKIIVSSTKSVLSDVMEAVKNKITKGSKDKISEIFSIFRKSKQTEE